MKSSLFLTGRLFSKGKGKARFLLSSSKHFDQSNHLLLLKSMVNPSNLILFQKSWSVPCVTVKTGNYTCFYVASTSRRIHAIALNEARKLQVTSPASCRLTYLQFAGEFTCGVIADCLRLQVILCGIAGFLPAIVRVFFPAYAVILPAFGGYFYLRF